jgi:DNA-binding response OmpR family regulator
MTTTQQGKYSARLFVLDDSKTFLSYAGQLLQSAGYFVHMFETHLGITREVIRHRPDLILVDQNMPSVTGDKVCRLLRSISQGREVLIVLHSTMEKRELLEIALQCGADDAIVKSQNPRDLLHNVQRLLSKRKGHSAVG